MTEKKTGYVLKDIVNVNQDWHERKMGLEGKLLLGRFDDDIYVYDTEGYEYQALDSMTLFEIDCFDSFDDLFMCNVGSYIDYDDEEPFEDDDENFSEDEEYPFDDEDYPYDDEADSAEE